MLNCANWCVLLDKHAFYGSHALASPTYTWLSVTLCSFFLFPSLLFTNEEGAKYGGWEVPLFRFWAPSSQEIEQQTIF